MCWRGERVVAVTIGRGKEGMQLMRQAASLARDGHDNGYDLTRERARERENESGRVSERVRERE